MAEKKTYSTKADAPKTYGLKRMASTKKTVITTAVPTIPVQPMSVDTSSSGPYLPTGGARERAKPIQLRSGNTTPFKMQGFSSYGNSPLRGCADDPTGKGCGDFKVKGTGKRKVKKAVRAFTSKIKDIFTRSPGEKIVRQKIKDEKRRKSSSKTSYQSPRTLS